MNPEGSREELISYFFANPTHPLVQEQIDRLKETDPYTRVTSETIVWAIGQAVMRGWSSKRA